MAHLQRTQSKYWTELDHIVANEIEIRLKPKGYVAYSAVGDGERDDEVVGGCSQLAFDVKRDER